MNSKNSKNSKTYKNNNQIIKFLFLRTNSYNSKFNQQFDYEFGMQGLNRNSHNFVRKIRKIFVTFIDAFTKQLFVE